MSSSAYGKGEIMLRAIVENTMRRVNASFRHCRLGKKLVVGLAVGGLLLADQGVSNAFNPARAYFRLMRQQMRWERGTPFLDFLGQQLQNDSLLLFIQGLIRQENNSPTDVQAPMTAQRPASEDQGLKSAHDRLVKAYEARYGTFIPTHPVTQGQGQLGPDVISTHRRIGLHIGLNVLSPTAWPGAEPLGGCVNDALGMRQLTQAAGFDRSDILLDQTATRAAVLKKIADAANELNAGDLFVLSLSSHGSHRTDDNGDERLIDPNDTQDELWCLFDDELKDDDVARSLAAFRPGVNVFVLLDTCHSGSATRVQASRRAATSARPRVRGLAGDTGPVRLRLLSDAVRQNVLENAASPLLRALQKRDQAQIAQDAAAGINVRGDGRENEPQASILLISACQDDEQAADFDTNGLFTGALLQVWNRGAFSGDHRDFHSQISQQLRTSRQRPNLFPTGENTATLEALRPFTAP